ncbi:MAG: SIS domain-containing protein [Dehalococcoidia bacterium]
MKNSDYLDQLDIYDTYDSTKYINRIANTAELFLEGINSKDVNNISIDPNIKSIYFMGMGGSGIGGEVFIDLVKNQLKLPIQTIKTWDIPNSINKHSLVFVCSYSGNTEETIKMFNDSINQKANIIIISRSGYLNDIAKLKKIPVIEIPNTLEARSSLSFVLGTLIAFFTKNNLININNKEIKDCISINKTLIDGLQTQISTTQNLAKNIATTISNSLPIIISADYLLSTANRWRTQLNENSKTIAVIDNLPEMFHNSIEGYESKVFKRTNPYFILLTSSLYPDSVSKKFDELKGLLRTHKLPHREIKAVGNYKLSHLFSLLTLGDYVSYYLAIGNKIDPHYNPIITNSKK